ncbi:MAG: molybdate ABC transporter substrate-binding protein [Leptolinea sp.]|jgi:iron complex transport system substrate-binding protein|nr:molybdate ABC transporter substrate-binding protein [Leptolinea sp.]
MRSRVFSILFLLIFLTTTAFTPVAAPAAHAAAADSKTLTVLAAASLTESFTELGKVFESKNAGVKVTFNFAGSQQLAQQLSEGAEADVFASARKVYMDAAVEARRVTKDDVRTFVKNRLVVISPKDNPGSVKELKDLAKAFVALVLSAEGQQVMANYGFIPSTGFTITDAMGRQVTFIKPPEKVVLAGKALFMIADAIYTFPEAGKKVNALGSTAQGSGNFIPMIDPAFKDKIVLEENAGAEAIAAAKPDCVIMKSINATSLGAPVEALGLPVVYLDFENPDQYQRDLKTLGQLFQNPDRAAKVATYYQSKLDEVTKTLSTLKEDRKPRALVLYYSEKEGAVSFNVPPLGWMQTIIVKTAGGEPVWEDSNPSKGWTKVNLEQIAAWDPEYIFVIAYFNPVDDVVSKLKADPQWQNLKAVKGNRLFGFARDVYSWDQPDTRWVLGLQWAAAKLHPDLIKGWDVTKASKDFYKELYGMDDTAYDKNIAPLLAGSVK